ncbi:MAG: quinone-dependent dihydroorotate dehydrogenase [Bacteroidetes bacterium]|nr:quinone-dependent dihydroorotate dehydrogenase [Bacteroidota bacterium]MDA1119848.1 quinone-dependent dihydroorotate dehydrogenase [Bacteroidota bacterium]
MYKSLLRPLLFLLSPEAAHHFTLQFLKIILWIPGFKSLFRAIFCFTHPKLERQLFGLKFPNPIGLAAGFDKNARYIDELSCLGFGFIEIGTITPKGQTGNPTPRLFRLPKDHSLINRMGFNNDGVEEAIIKLKSRKSKIIVGGNIGKNKVTDNIKATDDYLSTFDQLFDYVDYFVVNVSSPNTPNLRELQEKEPLTNLLSMLIKRNKEKVVQKPLLLKIAPDLTNSQLDDIVEITQELKLDGLVATNTTTSRDQLNTSEKTVSEIGAGGLSGKVLSSRSTEVIKYLNVKLKGKVPIIGVGGIFSAQDAIDKLEAGASLLQVYSGFIYEGPGLIKKLNKALSDR